MAGTGIDPSTVDCESDLCAAATGGLAARIQKPDQALPALR
jgi:hypothetical protein